MIMTVYLRPKKQPEEPWMINVKKLKSLLKMLE
jgi:hypothetical protein